jgi:GDP-L-fucose synthase
MRVTVLGGSGFIGSHVVEACVKAGHKVTATSFRRDPPPIHGATWLCMDLSQGGLFTPGTDVVIHCAAVTSGINDTLNRPQIHVADNVLMNTLAAVQATEVKVPHFIFLSSSLVYRSNNEPQDELALSTDFSGTRQPYFGVGWMKIYAEKLMEFYARRGETRFTILRPANIYGPRDKFDPNRSHVMGATIAKFLRAATHGLPEIVMWGNGTEARDFLYVDDLVDCVMRVIDDGRQVTMFDEPYEVFNVGSGTATTIRELAETVVATCANGSDWRPNIRFDPLKPTANTSLALESSKARDILGWKPKVSLPEGIAKTYEWLKEQGE